MAQTSLRTITSKAGNSKLLTDLTSAGGLQSRSSCDGLRLAEAEGTGTELSALREERDLIRSRVGEMLQQIDALNL